MAEDSHIRLQSAAKCQLPSHKQQPCTDHIFFIEKRALYRVYRGLQGSKLNYLSSQKEPRHLHNVDLTGLSEHF